MKNKIKKIVIWAMIVFTSLVGMGHILTRVLGEVTTLSKVVFMVCLLTWCYIMTYNILLELTKEY